MRIRLKTSIASPTFSYEEGEVVDWPDRAEALRLVRSGAAEPAIEAKGEGEAIEHAVTLAPPERRGRRGRGFR